MTELLDTRIRAFVVELVDQPVEPPAFPTNEAVVPPTAPRLQRLPRWAVAAAAFIFVLVVGVLVALFGPLSPEAPVVDTTPAGVVDQFIESVNDGEAGAALSLLAPDAQCVAPGLPSCEDLIGFFVAAEARITLFTDCGVENEPYLQCSGYMHSRIHDALGISPAELQDSPNFPPAFIIVDGRIVQFNFATPFTGDGDRDGRLWRYMESAGVVVLDDNGIPNLSPEIVAGLLTEAPNFLAEEENGN